MKQPVPVTIDACNACQLPHTIQYCSSQFQIWVAGMQLQLRTSVHVCPSFHPPKSPSSSMALTHQQCIDWLQEIRVSKAVRQRCVALTLHLGHSSSSTQAIGVKRPSNKVLNILQACNLLECNTVFIYCRTISFTDKQQRWVSHCHIHCFHAFCISHVIWVDRHQS